MRMRRIYLSLFVMATISLIVAAGCIDRSKHTPVITVVENHYVGNAACRECHKKEFDLHHGSNHDLTLRVADASALGNLTPPVGRIDATKYEITRNGGKTSFGRNDAAGKAADVDYAFGSGKIGMTYVAVKDADTILEMRMSRFPMRNAWYLTPGQEARSDDDIGAIHDAETSRKCFSCHSAALEPGSIRPDSRLFGVGCEACHGPSSAHIAAAKSRGSTDLHMDKLGKLGARKLNELCGKCHRTIETVNLGGTEASMTQRFQPYGLMQSPCFQKSNDTLSCLTCHNPHKNSSTSTTGYEAACLKCHSNTVSAGMSAPASNPPKVCPVNPSIKCIGCHMPPRKLFPFSRIPVYMADHLIWAYGKKSPYASSK